MYARACLHLALVALAFTGCSSSTTPGTDGGRVDAARLDGGARDADAVDAPVGPSACEAAGGMCGCAGGCAAGSHPAPAPLLDACPQPCDGCGACGQQCCLPDVDAGVPTGCGGATCAATDLCIHPCCGGAGPVCMPTPDGGPCDTGEACTLPDGANGCRTICTPPPPYCAPVPPAGCMIDTSGEVLCLCA